MGAGRADREGSLEEEVFKLHLEGLIRLSREKEEK